MARYVNKKYGITIGSGDWWSIRNGSPNGADLWRALVSVSSYRHNQHSQYVPFLASVTQQLVWQRNDDLDVIFNYYISKWMETNIGKIGVDWDYDQKTSMGMDTEIVFRTRRLAEKFVKFLETTTRGIIDGGTI